MQGRSHIASGVLAWPAFYPVVASTLTESPITVEGIIAGTLITAAASLLPDIDHPNGTIAHTYGQVSHYTARGVARVSGGHRGGTHSLLFLAGVFAALLFAGPVAIAVITGILAGFFVRGLKLFPKGFAQQHKTLFTTIVAVAITAALLFFPPTWEWFGFAVATGVLVHLLGDTITPGGVPYFWPAGPRISFPLLSASGSVMEVYVLAPLMAIAGVAWCVWLLF